MFSLRRTASALAICAVLQYVGRHVDALSIHARCWHCRQQQCKDGDSHDDFDDRESLAAAWSLSACRIASEPATHATVVPSNLVVPCAELIDRVT